MRKVIALFSAAVAVAALGGTAADAEPVGPDAVVAAPEDTGQGKLVWSSCNDPATPALQCALLEVPVDYADPHGRKIKIKVNRLPATAPKEKQQGPILLNPGGPGISGLWMPASISGQIPADVASTYDWIGFDPRGTNGSEPTSSATPTTLRPSGPTTRWTGARRRPGCRRRPGTPPTARPTGPGCCRT
ncbi:hypothetical protein ACFQ0M_40770 [Kitasatospora aburaviensis]